MTPAASHSESENVPPRCKVCGKSLPDDFRAALCPSCLLSDDALAGPGPSRCLEIEELQALFSGLEILGLAGSGGMGSVYKARQPRLNRFVAIKTLTPPPGHTEDFALRFEREAQVMARLDHPNIVTVHDFGEIDRSGEGLPSLFYLMMEHVDGADLNTLIRSGSLEPGQVLGLFAQICDALQYSHEEGITHRDIKPANLLVDRRGRVKIADFGLAKLLRGDETLAAGLTMTGTVMGTPHYMAPEQWEANALVDHRADIYSLGIVLYESLTGKRPVGAFALPSKVLGIDPRIDGIVSKAMECDPERRFQSVSEIKAAAAKVVVARARGVGRPALVAGAAGALVLALGFAVSAWNPEGREAGADPSPQASPSEIRSVPGTSFPKGRWIQVLSTQAEMAVDPVNKWKLGSGVRFVDGWMDATGCAETPSLQVTGLAGSNHGVRFRGKLGPDRKTWKGFTIMLRTGEPKSESRAAYQFALAGLDTPRPYLMVTLFSFSSRTGDQLAWSADFPTLEPGDEFEMEFHVVGEKLVARYNGRDLAVPGDHRLSSGEVFVQNSQLMRDLEAVNLDGLSEAEALSLLAAPESSDRASGSPSLAPITTDPASASKVLPFENSLGMRFVPVPGTDVLFCIHETRYKDYAVFAEANPGVNGDWRMQILNDFAPAERPEDHPAIRIDWHNSKAFCEWLSKKENLAYRLPTDREWSLAVGLDERWEPGDTPESVVKDSKEFPWGTAWPPPPGAGNYGDVSRKAKAPGLSPDLIYFKDYDDGFPTTAPVMSFPPNRFGLHDMGGNMLEWVEDWYSIERTRRTLRGGASGTAKVVDLLSSHRIYHLPSDRHYYCGFRVVVESPPSAMAAPGPSLFQPAPSLVPSDAHAKPGSQPPPLSQWNPAASRAAATVALRYKAVVTVEQNGKTQDGPALPEGDFRVLKISFPPGGTELSKRLTPEETKVILNARELTNLSLQECGNALSAEVCEALGRMPYLSSLSLQQTNLRDEWMASLAPAPELRNLQIDGTRVTDQGMAALGSSSTLENLRANTDSVSGMSIASLAIAHQLRLVSLGKPSQTRDWDDDIRAILDACPNLETLLIMGNVSPAAFEGIDKAKRLTLIKLGDFPLVREHFEALVEAPALQKLIFGRLTAVPDEAWSLLPNFKSLKQIEVNEVNPFPSLIPTLKRFDPPLPIDVVQLPEW